ncbi:MAG: hypothetical protein QM569_14860 [Acidovorax sp.]|uniref:hypothetical protein n=1 Tax=Acidovorax sp. TaxID=1872122 RepID=UPI0039E721D2
MARKTDPPQDAGGSQAKPDKAFVAALSMRLRERARLLLAGQTEVLQALQDARAQILTTLAGQPADWQQWQLTRLLAQIETVLEGATAKVGALFEQRMQAAWQQGEAVVDKPLSSIGHNVELRLPVLDAGVLKQMQAFGTLRLKDVGREAAGKIGRQLGLVTLGAQTPFAAIKAVGQVLGGQAAQRAATIVHTEVSRAFAVAANERLVQAAGLVPGLGKQWRRSGKIHSRWNHDLIDGQVAEAGKPFKVPNPGGGIDLMQCPHDPKAPPEQVIRCGCISLPWMKHWKVTTPGAKPFTAQELRLDGRKAALDAAAKKAGARRELPTGQNADMAFKQPRGDFTVYDGAYPQKTADTSTPARAAAVALENQVRRDDLETAAFFSPAGAERIRKTGQPNMVSFTAQDLAAVRAGDTFSHNHPGNGTFSLDDIENAAELRLAEIRAVGPTLRHMMAPGAVGWPTTAQLQAEVARAAEDAQQAVAALVGADELAERFAQAELNHQVWVRVARKFGLRYTREKS